MLLLPSNSKLNVNRENCSDSSVDTLELKCNFAKLSLNSRVIPDDDATEDFTEKPVSYQLENAERHRKTGSWFRYMLFDTQDPGGFSIEEENTDELRTLNPRVDRNKYRVIINISLYNEEPNDLACSLKGVTRSSHCLPENFSDKVLILLIADGLFALLDNPLMLEYLAALRLFSLPDIIKYKIRKPERLLYDKCYAFESRVYYNELTESVTYDDRKDPYAIDIVLLIKPENMRKLHSHL